MPEILFVAGNHGKSTLSYYLAKQLSLLGKTVVLSTNSFQPVAQTLFFEQENISDKSLGKLLSYPIIDKQRLFEHLIVLEDNLAYLSYAPNETALHYPEVIEDTVTDLIDALGFVNWLIIDASRELTTLDTLLLAKATRQFLIYSADRKGIAYRNHLLSKLLNAKTIAVQNSKYNPIADIPCDYLIPYAKQLEPIGNISEIRSTTVPKAYDKVLKKLKKEVL